MYKIEIYIYGELVKTFETNYFEEAAVFYCRNNDFDDRWTQLYVNGKTGNKAWMDKQMKPGKIPKNFYLFSLTS